jgi:predicted O-linked N-acetylglucosamine transferase (SPINDLY family)
MDNWQQQAEKAWAKEQYHQAAILYEQAIAKEPHIASHYWYLGLAQLLQGQESEAQMTWFEGISEIAPNPSPTQIEIWTEELVAILTAEVQHQQALSHHQVAWAICQHIRELQPLNINNLLQIIILSVQLGNIDLEGFHELELLESLQAATDNPSPEQVTPEIAFPNSSQIDRELLLQALKAIADYPPLMMILPEFAEAIAPYFASIYTWLDALIRIAVHLGYYAKQVEMAIELLELCLRWSPENIEVLKHLSPLYQNAGKYDRGIDAAKLCLSLDQSLPDRIYASHLLLRGFLGSGGRWQEAIGAFEHHQALLVQIFQEHPTDLNPTTIKRFSVSTFLAPYLKDDARQNRLLQNQVSQLCQANIAVYAQKNLEKYRRAHQARRTAPKGVEHGQETSKLKIGYLSHCLNSHSVGWLARWLLQHHDRDRFELYGYFIGYKQVDDPLQAWYLSQMDRVYRTGIDGAVDSLAIADRIFDDGIDILVDLDSITIDLNCEVLALKPAPVQVTWLGCDASGIDTVDYFIADPYVLTDDAQDYYTEKIWRLPRTYIAVDGFEVAVPSLRRDLLEIPNDAVIYFSAQRGYKRHPDTVRLQMRILKAVPNSYFLVKGLSDAQSVRDSFLQIAEEEGVSSDRLRFLPTTSTEAIHRADMGIADVILDTYPYNGATTTLEALWMCVPLVTRVGEQFFARYSYTMMTNIGITEGIAYTDEEYVEWGIRLGRDSNLRQQISWRLRQSRQTSPLWDGESFARDMEDAYRQMWLKYIEKESFASQS